MQFNSVQFMFFFPAVCAVYFVIPRKLRVPWLLTCSYVFYMTWNVKYAALMATSTLATYLSGLALAGPTYQTPDGLGVRIRPQRSAKDRAVLALCIVFNLAILAVFKYGNMILATVRSTRTLDLLLPVGISFYTFQALGYIIDVYRGDTKTEKNILRYALFVSFFPQLVAGPIERSRNLLSQVQHAEEKKLWNAERVTQGAILMVWGFFLKMVISDRAAVFVDAVWDNYSAFGRVPLLLATLAFTLQIYCDFGGYSMIAIGAAKILGFDLMENFNTPYLATSIRDFWARWHISLSTWFRDYLYIPLGGNRKGEVRRIFNLLVTFLISGLWHGADWSFVLWGGIHGVGQLIEDLFTGKNRRAPGGTVSGMRAPSKADKLTTFVRWGFTLAFVNFAWIFFRAPSIAAALDFLKCFVHNSGVNDLVLPVEERWILAIAVLVLVGFDWVKRHGGQTPDRYLMSRKLSTEWGILIFLIVAIFVFGEYGPTFDPKAFIYFQF